MKSLPNITLSIPEHLYKKMKQYPEIKWSVIIRRYLEEFIDKLENVDREKTDEILKKLDGIKDELKQISDEKAIAFALEMVKKRGKMYL